MAQDNYLTCSSNSLDYSPQITLFVTFRVPVKYLLGTYTYKWRSTVHTEETHLHLGDNPELNSTVTAPFFFTGYKQGTSKYIVIMVKMSDSSDNHIP